MLAGSIRRILRIRWLPCRRCKVLLPSLPTARCRMSCRRYTRRVPFPSSKRIGQTPRPRCARSRTQEVIRDRFLMRVSPLRDGSDEERSQEISIRMGFRSSARCRSEGEESHAKPRSRKRITQIGRRVMVEQRARSLMCPRFGLRLFESSRKWPATKLQRGHGSESSRSRCGG